MNLITFNRLIGQNQAVHLLTSAVLQNRIAPAYLFAGPAGVGRSLAAECFIELLFNINSSKHQKRRELKNHPDLLWVEPTYLYSGQLLTARELAEASLKRKTPPQIRLEQVREIGQFLARKPLEAPRSLVAIEQAETMNESAANALLKTLEEPGQATIILIAPSAESLLPTLVSRCQQIPFYRLTFEEMAQVLQQAGYGEIVEHSPVMAMAQGSPGEAIASMQQLMAIPNELRIALTELPKTLRQSLELAKEIDKTLDTEAQLWLIDYLQHCYWQQTSVRKLHESPLHALEKARQYLRQFAQPRLVWEIALMSISCLIQSPSS